MNCFGAALTLCSPDRLPPCFVSTATRRLAGIMIHPVGVMLAVLETAEKDDGSLSAAPPAEKTENQAGQRLHTRQACPSGRARSVRMNHKIMIPGTFLLRLPFLGALPRRAALETHLGGRQTLFTRRRR